MAGLGDDIDNDFVSNNIPIDPPEDSEWPRQLRAGAKRQALDPDIGRNHTVYMEEAGFVDVRGGNTKCRFARGRRRRCRARGE